MQVNIQLKTADGSVASSLGFESQVDAVVKGMGLRMYPRYPGTQDSIQGTLFRIPVEDAQSAERVIEVLRDHDGVQSAAKD